MGTALSILTLIATGLPILIKVLEVILEAAKTFQESKDKEKWAMETLTTKLPKLSQDEIYAWVKIALYAARLVGVKI